MMFLVLRDPLLSAFAAKVVRSCGRKQLSGLKRRLRTDTDADLQQRRGGRDSAAAQRRRCDCNDVATRRYLGVRPC